jgi:hypothetical protein
MPRGDRKSGHANSADLNVGATKGVALHYVLEIKGVNCEELKPAKIYVIEIKRVIYSAAPSSEKTRGGKCR